MVVRSNERGFVIETEFVLITLSYFWSGMIATFNGNDHQSTNIWIITDQKRKSACALIVWLVLCDFEVNQTKIKGGCQSGRKVVPHDSNSDLSLVQHKLSRKQVQSKTFLTSSFRGR